MHRKAIPKRTIDTNKMFQREISKLFKRVREQVVLPLTDEERTDILKKLETSNKNI
jgi:ribosomal protein S18